MAAKKVTGTGPSKASRARSSKGKSATGTNKTAASAKAAARKNKETAAIIDRKQRSNAREAASTAYPWDSDTTVRDALDTADTILGGLKNSNPRTLREVYDETVAKLTALNLSDAVNPASPESLSKAAVTAQSARSTIVGVKAKAIDASVRLSELLDTARLYIRSAHGDFISGMGGTKDERQGAMDSALVGILDARAKATRLIETCDTVVDDLDSWARTIRFIGDMATSSAAR